MERKFTPGPWLREGGFIYSLVDVKARDIRKNGPRQVNRFMASFQGCNAEYGATESELEANAQLAISAPELLEALEEAMNCSPNAFWITQARAAIAKATGRDV